MSVLNEKMKTAAKYAFSKLSSKHAYKYKSFPQKWEKKCFFTLFLYDFSCGNQNKKNNLGGMDNQKKMSSKKRN